MLTLSLPITYLNKIIKILSVSGSGESQMRRDEHVVHPSSISTNLITETERSL
jgi:hypothetical protein